MNLTAVVADERQVRNWLMAAEKGDEMAMKAASAGVPFGQSAAPQWWGDGRGSSFAFGSSTPGAKANYESRAGDLTKNAVVAACVGWMLDNVGQAKIRVYVETSDGDDEAVKDHPLVKMLRRPNEYYPTRILLAGTTLDWKLYGNAYWLKLRGGGPNGPVVGVRRLPACTTRPKYGKGPTAEYIEGFEYQVGSRWETIPGGREAVVHLRDGISPDDERMGWRRVGAVLRQVSAHNEGTTYMAATLENGGVASVVFSGTDEHGLNDADRLEIKNNWQKNTSGANRGMPVAFEYPINAQEIGRTPQEMAIDTILDRPVSEICALLRLSPMVVGFPDDARTYSNMGEARRAAHEDCIIPLQDAIADDLTHQLLPDFGDDETQMVGWDRSRVQALSEDKTEKISRAVVAFQGGLCNLAVAQGIAELPETEGAEDEWYAPGGTPETADETPQDPADPEDDPFADEEDMPTKSLQLEGEDGIDPFGHGPLQGCDEDWDDPVMLAAIRAHGIDPDAAEYGIAAKAEYDDALKAKVGHVHKDPKTGKTVSKRSKTGNPACSSAMSRWKLSGMTPEIASTLALCRAQAHGRRKADQARQAGHEGRAQAHEARVARGKPLTKKDRIRAAKELRAKRAGGMARAPKADHTATMASIPPEVRPAKLGKMAIDPKARNGELDNFREQHPDAKITDIPITPALRDKAMEHFANWRRMGDDRELAKVRSILAADKLPPPIVQFYGSGTVGIPDGFHRVAAYVLTGRTSIRGYALGELPAAKAPTLTIPHSSVQAPPVASVRQQADAARAARRNADPATLSDKQLAKAYVARAHGPGGAGGTHRDVLDGHMVFNGPEHLARQGRVLPEAIRRGLVEEFDQGGPRQTVGYRLSTRGQDAIGVTMKNSRRVAEQHAGFPKAKAVAARLAASRPPGPTVTPKQLDSHVEKAIRSTPARGEGADSELVPIHAIRDQVERAVGGPVPAAEFDRILKRMRAEGKIRIVAISDNRDMTAAQLDRSIPGMNETLAYVVREGKKKR